MDLKEVINIQLKERYKHFIIHGPALSGKTKIALKIVEQYQCKYVSLLDSLLINKEIKSNIDIFGPSKLIQYIKNISGNEDFVIIDQVDFLINIWSDGEVRELMAFIDKNQSNYCYLFIMQTHKLLANEELISLSDKGTQRQLMLPI